MGIHFHFGPRHNHRHGGYRRRRRYGGVSVGTTISSSTSKILVAALLLFIAFTVLFFVINGKNRTAHYVEVQGRVVDYRINDDGLYGEVVEYEVNGYRYIVYSNSYSSFPKNIGSSITVKYNPAAPSQAVLNTPSDNIVTYGIVLVFGVIGVILLVSGIRGKTSLVDKQEY